MYWGDHFWGMHAFWWIFWLVVIAALFFWSWPRASSSDDDSAIEALRRRYAAGDIDEVEFERRLAVLERDRAHRNAG